MTLRIALKVFWLMVGVSFARWFFGAHAANRALEIAFEVWVLASGIAIAELTREVVKR